MIKGANGWDLVLKTEEGRVVGYLKAEEFLKIEKWGKRAKYYFIRLVGGETASFWVKKTRIADNGRFELFLGD